MLIVLIAASTMALIMYPAFLFFLCSARSSPFIVTPIYLTANSWFLLVLDFISLPALGFYFSRVSSQPLFYATCLATNFSVNLGINSCLYTWSSFFFFSHCRTIDVSVYVWPASTSVFFLFRFFFSPPCLPFVAYCGNGFLLRQIIFQMKTRKTMCTYLPVNEKLIIFCCKICLVDD